MQGVGVPLNRHRIILWLLPLVLTIAAAFALTYVMARNEAGEGLGRDRALQAYPVRLTDQNTVDEIAELPFELNIDHVQVKPGLLAIDLKMGQGGTAESAIYDDVYTLLHFAFIRTLNIDQVLLRVLTNDEEGNKLLLSMEAKRESWLSLLRDQKDRSQFQSSGAFRAFRDIHYTQEWFRRFRGRADA